MFENFSADNKTKVVQYIDNDLNTHDTFALFSFKQFREQVGNFKLPVLVTEFFNV